MTNPTSGIGHNQRTSGSSWKQASRYTANASAQNTTTCARESRPAGSSRVAVRGLRASISASTSRLMLIASERAPTIASVIQTKSCSDGSSFLHSSAPMYANGSAKPVCSIFTSDAKRRGRATVLIAAPSIPASLVGAADGRASELVRPDVGIASDASCRSMLGRIAREQLERVTERGLDQLEPVAAAAGGARQVDDQGLAANARDTTSEQPVRRLAHGVGAEGLGNARHGAFEHRLGRLGREVARRDARAAGRQDESCRLCELSDRGR